MLLGLGVGGSDSGPSATASSSPLPPLALLALPAAPLARALPIPVLVVGPEPPELLPVLVAVDLVGVPVEHVVRRIHEVLVVRERRLDVEGARRLEDLEEHLVRHAFELSLSPLLRVPLLKLPVVLWSCFHAFPLTEALLLTLCAGIRRLAWLLGLLAASC